MGKKTDLLHECMSALRSSRKGSYKTRQEYIAVMKAVVRDLHKLRCAPRRWAELTAMQVQSLAMHWKKRKQTLKTIANKLGVLRRYYQWAGLPNVIPCNKSLGVIMKAPSIKIPSNENDIIERVFHPITKSIVQLEIEFGLTKAESIRVAVNTVTANERLTVYRDVAYNHRDRIIPITTPSQQKAIDLRLGLLQDDNKLTDKLDFARLSNMYCAELLLAGLKTTPFFRRSYAVKRYKQLFKSEVSEEAITILQAEMGLSSPYTLRRWCHE